MGLLFQDREMKTTFSAYPEFLCLDATYKLLELGHLMLSEDANGQSEVIAVCLLVQKDADSVTWMVDAFKNNEDWHKICIIMADKDIGEGGIEVVHRKCICSHLFVSYPAKPFIERYHVKKWEFHLAKEVHC